MRRPTFPATLLCALLPLATIGLWAQSYAFPFFKQYADVKRIAFFSGHGHAYLIYLHPPTPATSPFRPMYTLDGRALPRPTMTANPIVDRTFTRLFTLAYYPDTHTARRGWIIQVPYPILLIPTVALTGLAFLLDRHRLKPARRRQAGLCPACGYDLRATPTQCPECGSPA